MYKRLIKLNPAHIEAQHNLCVVMVEERDLKGAESCLLGVYNMAPHLDYIQGNVKFQHLHLHHIYDHIKIRDHWQKCNQF